MAKGWSGIAFNQVPNSNNKIHGDDVAKQYGFKGGLVPGVTLSAYLVQPAIDVWGEAWLNRGCAHVKVLSPVYHGDSFAVRVQSQDQSYTASLESENKVCAQADVSLITDLPLAPQPQEHIFLNDEDEKPPATPETMEKFLENGCPAKRFEWHADHEMVRYLEDAKEMPPLLQIDATNPNALGKANLSFLLGCANRHFAAVASMSPWVHMETKSQNFQAVDLNTSLISEMEVLDLFNKKGHEFADCEFNLFDESTGHCVCSIWQRAIYQLRKND